MLSRFNEANDFIYQTALRREKDDGFLLGWEIFVLLCEKNPWFKDNTWSSKGSKLNIVNLDEADSSDLKKLMDETITWRTDTSEGVSSIFGDHPIAWWLNWFQKNGIKLGSPAYEKLDRTSTKIKNEMVKNVHTLLHEGDPKNPHILQSIRQFRKQREADPYTYSGLIEYFLLDTWRAVDALCLICGIHPQGAEIEWNGYFNFADVHIDEPKLLNCQALDEDDFFYITPYDHESEINLDNLDGTIKRKREKLKQLEEKLQLAAKIWESGIDHPSRNPPIYYIEWANRKGIPVEWQSWAFEKGLLTNPELKKEIDTSENNSERSTEEKTLGTRERNTLLKIIKALCTAQGLDLKQPYKDAEIIKNEIELAGGAMSIETIAGKLEQAKQS